MARTKYIWNPVDDQVVMEKDAQGATSAVYTQEAELHADLISQRRADETSYYHFDGQGSTRALTAQDETVTDSYVFNAFGEQVAQSGSTSNPWGYNGAVGYYTNGETDDVYVRARTYAPTISRWLAQDPLRFGDGPCVYCYVLNGPVNHVDPSGLAGGAQQYNPYATCRREAGPYYGIPVDCDGYVRQETRKADSGLWYKNLIDCPCSLPIRGGPIVTAVVTAPKDSNGWRWTAPAKANQYYHPGADWCVRAYKTSGGPGQQCCYKEFVQGQPKRLKVELITGGPAAGTPDRHSPGPASLLRLDWLLAVEAHLLVDVSFWQKCLSEGKLETYLTYFPPNRGIGCSPLIV